jgi:hypothetical protein
MASRKGCPNKSGKEARAVINKLLPPKKRYGLLKELAQGVYTLNDKGDKIYSEKPDVVALKFLSEMADGKAIQRVDPEAKGVPITVTINYSKDGVPTVGETHIETKVENIETKPEAPVFKLVQAESAA